MRVIAGKAKRMPLKTIPGNGTRPTTDRIKETLFNMIQDHIYGSRFLDLFSGSGAIAFSIIFMDPPYDHLWEKRVLEALAASCIVDDGTLIITEASLGTDFSYLDTLGYEVVRRKEYKTNVHMFLRRIQKEETIK